ncbi:NAD(P)H-quinone oxidoreductase [Paracoccus zhejiangensis]|uniref:NAD(P)H-quinone oxidoreductase n=1 Tax=Paracoccus zhejiangensis TaxID=1077935 RepID=A0A2H5F3M3_9RHOB|nr:NAD(P)H-quinone oxidoreductase [Paracoccus zhejiangensis]AUH66146.1 NAD(P)H-quinone oxidoreductase [Paracoccus zhejiangensis]
MTLPTEMTVVEISEPGGPEVLRHARRPLPVPAPGQVLIRIAYAGVNRPDVAQRAGVYPPPPGASDLPGLEASGHIAALGEGVTGWTIGEAVTALLPGGGYAEYAVTDARHVLPVPEGMSLRDAAGLCETLFTVWSNVFQRGALQPGETFLVHGGTSGIGTTAIQLAHAKGARVIATAGSAAKCQACLDLGADLAINYRETDFVAAVQAEGGADVILDMVGGAYLPRNIQALKEDGRLVEIAFLEGTHGELDILSVMLKRLTVTGSTLRRQSHDSKARIAASLRAEVWPMIAKGGFAPQIDSEFALADAVEAHRLMEASTHIGKIILKVA